MNKNSYRVLAAFSSFFFSFICLGVTTYAWYALANATNVDNIRISLRGDDRIDLGLKSDDPSLQEKYGSSKGEWVDNIFFVNNTLANVDEEMLIDFGYLNEDTLLAPVSSAHQGNWLNDSTNYSEAWPELTKMPTLADRAGSTTVKMNERDQFFYQFEFYVRASNPVYLFLDEETTIDANIEENTKTASRLGVPVEQLNAVENYMRLSVLSSEQYLIYEPHPTYENGIYQATDLYGRLDLTKRDGYYDYDSISYREIVYGSYTGEQYLVYDESGRASGNIIDYNSGGFTANSYRDAIPVDLAKSQAAGFVGEIQPTLLPETLHNDDYRDDERNSLCLLGRNEVQRLVVSCWAEGWDFDCNLYSQQSTFTMNFEIGCEYPDSYLN